MIPPHISTRYFTIAVRLGIVLALCCIFVGVALAASVTDYTIDHFSQGTGDCFVSQADTGQTAGAVIVSPTAGTNFSGTVPDAGWFIGGNSTITNGNLYANEGQAGTLLLYPPSRSAEFVATFRSVDSQHGGLALDLFAARWVIFSTGNNGSQLLARSNNGSDPELTTGLGSSYFGTPHLYRVDWEPNSVIYWIDGTAVATHSITFTENMRPLVADLNGDSAISLTVNWMRMSDYAPSPCTFTSRVINSGAVGTSWTNFTATVDQPTGTSSSFEVHASTDNANWSDWQLVTSNTINLTGQYLQYRATLTTTDPLVTPQLLGVSIEGNPTAVELQSFSAGTATSDATRWLIATLAASGLLLGLSSAYLIRRRKQI